MTLEERAWYPPPVAILSSLSLLQTLIERNQESPSNFSNYLIKHFKRSPSLPKPQSKCLPALATAAPATAPPAPAPAALTKQLSPNIPMGPSLPPPLRQPCVDAIMS
ncbi:hypothetical protein DTO207G8_2852 [Paecilomyces variotii]|nr:hypothetical protein DTO169E5_8079 [Paecilomyces variotii]KAJ9255835.1 hypothetical protein DTO207G8_2852 [Paecilomyces variotii]